MREVVDDIEHVSLQVGYTISLGVNQVLKSSKCHPTAGRESGWSEVFGLSDSSEGSRVRDDEVCLSREHSGCSLSYCSQSGGSRDSSTFAAAIYAIHSSIDAMDGIMSIRGRT